tara:strand:+ start:83 stop:1075 length:993 start_codon:yes stop_codon:yes gene_type:complete
MTKISLIGVSPASVSFALTTKNLTPKPIISAYSSDSKIFDQIKHLEAIDDASNNLEKVVLNSDMIVLDLSISEIKSQFEQLRHLVKNDCIITDFSHSKKRIESWAIEILPQNFCYIPARPLIKMEIPQLSDSNPQIFKGIRYCIMESEKSTKDGMEWFVKFIELLGNKPFFLDIHEHDSYTAATEILLPIVSSSIINSLSKNDSWSEMRKFVNFEFEKQTELANQDPIETEINSITASQPLIYWLDQTIKSLYEIRNSIDQNSDELLNLLIDAWEVKGKIFAGIDEDLPQHVELPSSSQSIASAMFGAKLASRMGDQGDKNLRKSWEYPR